MDAVDVALVDFQSSPPALVHYAQYPITDEIRRDVRVLDQHSPVTEVARLDAVLGGLFGDAVLNLLGETGLQPHDIAAIGSHGQTILHLPDADPPRTLQIGDPNLIARRTGITTVADFRRMDLAAGGQGAPLAPAFHACYFRSPEADRVILNIGGIANITLLPADPSMDVTGFDTGPGNGLLDDWNRQHRGTDMDRDGDWAASGTVADVLLQSLEKDAYFSRKPPKSSGRDYFNLDWLRRHLAGFGTLDPADVQATLLQLTVGSIATAVTGSAPAARELYICGGGVHNPLLVDGLRRSLPGVHSGSTAELGVDPDAVEAVTFAWLAKRRLDGEPGNLPAVTGAQRAVLLGGIYKPWSQATSHK